MAKVRTVEEIMGFVKELSPLKLYEFKGEFEEYVLEVGNLFHGSTKESVVKESVAQKAVKVATKEVESAKTTQVESEPIAEKANKKNGYKKSKNMSARSEWQEYFKRVAKSGYQHGSELPEDAPLVLTSSAKDTDECILAALVNINGVATNAVWSGAYPMPVVFGKLSLKSLEQIKKAILHKFPENAQRIEACKGPNGQAENFYYDELEDGNFCHRITQKDGSIVYFGYIIDKDICFYRNVDDSTSIINTKYFFMPRWGTHDCRDNKDDEVMAVSALIDRAFGNNDDNDTSKTSKNIEDAQEEVNSEVERQANMDRRAQMKNNQKSKKRDLSQDRTAKRHKRRAYDED